jgi:hypothetical protein
MAKRPYLVLRGQMCIPLEGPYRVEWHEEQWYVLGQHEVRACPNATEAHVLCEQLRHPLPAHRLAQQALADLPHDYEVVQDGG